MRRTADKRLSEKKVINYELNQYCVHKKKMTPGKSFFKESKNFLNKLFFAGVSDYSVIPDRVIYSFWLVA